jgi:hypothetical protein
MRSWFSQFDSTTWAAMVCVLAADVTVAAIWLLHGT